MSRRAERQRPHLEQPRPGRSVARGHSGPLTIHPTNPRYFADGSGKAIYLTGSHTWNNLQDMGMGDPPPAFEFDAYLDFLVRHHHNFIRLWRWEQVAWELTASVEWTAGYGVFAVGPHPWARPGPGTALDGKPKFDLATFDPAYFDRLRSRIEAAGERGIYVSVMLFEGWAPWHIAWGSHPFHKANNVNDIDGDADGDGRGLETHTLNLPAVTRLQEAYVRRVIDTVGDLDNVLYEIANESGTYSIEWQYHLIRLIKEIEGTRPKQHPVGMTFVFPKGPNAEPGSMEPLVASPADWISPSGTEYRDDPPPADGKKVILNDTDHLWGIGGTVDWAWKSFCRGMHPIFMDPYENRLLGRDSPDQWDPLRGSLGQTLRLAEQMNLASMTPQGGLASTGYCLADVGREYLVYVPDGEEITVDLTATPGLVTAEWLHPVHGTAMPGGTIGGGANRTVRLPSKGPTVLHLANG